MSLPRVNLVHRRLCRYSLDFSGQVPSHVQVGSNIYRVSWYFSYGADSSIGYPINKGVLLVRLGYSY